ncbi:hypothetical protein D3C78_20440 [compost metagenome]
MRNKIDSYIKKVITDACVSENKPNDVTYQFGILEGTVIFVINTRYIRVKRKIQYRLQNGIPKNFDLKFNEGFDIVIGAFDLNFAIARWDVFEHFATISAFWPHNHLRPLYTNFDTSGEWVPAKHIEELAKVNGVMSKEEFHENWTGYEDGIRGWNKYLEDYKKVYGYDMPKIYIS